VPGVLQTVKWITGLGSGQHSPSRKTTQQLFTDCRFYAKLNTFFFNFSCNIKKSNCINISSPKPKLQSVSQRVEMKVKKKSNYPVPIQNVLNYWQTNFVCFWCTLMHILWEINVQCIMQHDGFIEVKIIYRTFSDTTQDDVIKRIKIEFTEVTRTILMHCTSWYLTTCGMFTFNVTRDN